MFRGPLASELERLADEALRARERLRALAEELAGLRERLDRAADGPAPDEAPAPRREAV